MSTRATSIALFVSTLCVALLVFHILRSDDPVAAHTENTPRPAGEAHHASTDKERLAEIADKSFAATRSRSGPANAASNGGAGGDGTNDPPRAQAPLEHPGLPEPMAQALQGVGLGGAPPSQALETERVFSAEAIDPLWSPGMEDDINSEIAQITGRDVLTQKVECRTSMCRVQMTLRVPLQGEQATAVVFEVYGKLSDNLGFEHRPVMLAIDSGVPTSLVYLPRQGAAEAGTNAHRASVPGHD